MENNKNKLDSVVIHSEEFLRHKLDLGVAEIYISALKYNGKIEKAYFKLLEFLKIPEFENFVKNELIDRPAYMLMDVLEGENNYIKIMKTFRKELNFGFEEIDSLLDSIEKNPTKFLKDDKITTLSSFIKGYTFAMSENTMPTYRGVSIFAFSSYLRNKYRDSRSFNEFGFIMEHEKDGKKISAYFRLLGEYRKYKAMIRVCDSGSSWIERASVRPRLLAATTMAVCSGRIEISLRRMRGESQWPAACASGVAMTQVASTFWSNWRRASIIRPNSSSRPTTSPQLPSRWRM